MFDELGPIDNIDFILLREAKNKGKHLTMKGKLVDCYSQACLNDLRSRLDDAKHTRDLASTRSDERIYYNGILRVLRRKIRAVEKEMRKQGTLIEERKSRLTGRGGSRAGSRMLRLSGIF